MKNIANRKLRLISTIINKRNLSLFILLLVAYNAFSQQVQQPTTMDEYNYVTKGYKIQIETGLDMKKGYSLKDMMHYSAGERTVALKGLYRSGEQSPCAIMIIYLQKGEKTQYYCVPTFNTDESIWKEFYTSLNDVSSMSNEGMDKLIIFVLAQAQMRMFQK